MASEKQGCLSLLLPFLRSKREPEPVPEVLPYRLRDDFLSPTELSFYKVLSTILGDRFVVLAKVRLADIFFVVRAKENFTHFNRISQRHVDFLVCEPARMRPLLGIELDDASHQTPARQRRDEFVERVFRTARLPLLRFPAQRAYNTQEIAARLARVLEVGRVPERPQGSPQVHASADAPPLCPKCGVPMVLRTAQRGKYKGRQFYGCVNYPRCREIKLLPPQEER